MASSRKRQRHDELLRILGGSPFLTDEDLARELVVSVPTIRLGRMELGIPELRERIRSMASQARTQVKTMGQGEVIGELLSLELGRQGVSLLIVTPDMVFERNRLARGQEVFGQANSLALAVIDSSSALTGVANVKFRAPLRVGDKLVARAEVMRRRGNKHFVWVKTYCGLREVFRGKFIIVAYEE